MIFIMLKKDDDTFWCEVTTGLDSYSSTKGYPSFEEAFSVALNFSHAKSSPQFRGLFEKADVHWGPGYISLIPVLEKVDDGWVMVPKLRDGEHKPWRLFKPSATVIKNFKEQGLLA